MAWLALRGRAQGRELLMEEKREGFGRAPSYQLSNAFRLERTISPRRPVLLRPGNAPQISRCPARSSQKQSLSLSRRLGALPDYVLALGICLPQGGLPAGFDHKCDAPNERSPAFLVVT